jgi:hypothetical protein
MIIKDLIEQLQKYNPNMKVMVVTDVGDLEILSVELDSGEDEFDEPLIMLNT